MNCVTRFTTTLILHAAMATLKSVSYVIESGVAKFLKSQYPSIFSIQNYYTSSVLLKIFDLA